jgi:hypothetical protein
MLRVATVSGAAYFQADSAAACGEFYELLDEEVSICPVHVCVYGCDGEDSAV